MTAEKAASLTSSLLARKGAARPAALDHDLYRPVPPSAGQPGPTAVVTPLHPPRDEAVPCATDDADDGGEAETPEAAPEAALTDLQVAVEARADGESAARERPAPDAFADDDLTGDAPTADSPPSDDAPLRSASREAAHVSPSRTRQSITILLAPEARSSILPMPHGWTA